MTDFDWSDYLPLAERLAADNDEAARRSAISRAYYAAYHAAARYVRARQLLVDNHTHQTVWRVLAGDADPARQHAGVSGQRLHYLRTEADYRQPFPGDIAAKTAGALADARQLIADIARLT